MLEKRAEGDRIVAEAVHEVHLTAVPSASFHQGKKTFFWGREGAIKIVFLVTAFTLLS